MRNTKNKGFSLAEVLISLTVVSIMLAVAAPVITKQHVGDETWKWTQGGSVKNGASFDGNNVVVGNATVPSQNNLNKGNYFESLVDRKFSGDLHSGAELKNSAIKYMFLSNNILQSKLSILKTEPKSIFARMSDGAFKDSYISFYNLVNGNMEYAGRLTGDSYQLALGLGALQSSDNQGCLFNSAYCYRYDKRPATLAIGHYALSSFLGHVAGTANVALGYGALSNKTGGSYDTAIGYKAAFNPKDNAASSNTIIGNHTNNNIEEITGWSNLIIGNYDNLTPSDMKNWGSDNIFIGHNAGRGLPKKDLKYKDEDGTYESVSFDKYDYAFAIGNVDPTKTDETGVELLQGKTQLATGRKLVVNGDFVVRTGDGSKTLFKVDATSLVIDPTNNVNFFEGRTDIFTDGSHNGPERCEGAEICIAKFKAPLISDGNHNGYHDVYDVYVKGMINTNVARTSLLGTSLFILDRGKESMDSIMRTFESLNKLNNGPTFIEELFGIDLTANSFSSFLESFFGWPSDIRLKNIYGDSQIGLKEIEALKVKNYTYKADKTKTPHVGVIAQELQKVFPNSVIKGNDGYLSIKQEEMFYGLVNSIQELADKSDEVSEKLALSKEQVEYTKKQNELIKQENNMLRKQNQEFAKRIARLQKKKT